MSKVISISNQKGGCGKSTVSFNLAAGLARKGKSVLCIDNDPQGNLTMSMGHHKPDDLPYTISSIVEKIADDQPFEPEKGILTHDEGVSLMPANIQLSGFEAALINVYGREAILKQYVDRVRDHYDFVLIDTSPSLNMLTINALTASDTIIIPTTPQFFSAKGMELLLSTYSRLVRRKINEELRIEGILINMMDSRPNFTKEVASLVRSTFSEKIRVFHTEIPTSVRVSESSAEGISIFKHDPNGKVAQAYEAFVEEILA
ncbi:MAG: ParA family protein [Christensenellaceae bacterium]|jgi:chromosome partitioning protein